MEQGGLYGFYRFIGKFFLLKTESFSVFTPFQHKIIFFSNLSLGFILKTFLKFRKFQPRYSYKMYSYRRKEYSNVNF